LKPLHSISEADLIIYIIYMASVDQHFISTCIVIQLNDRPTFFWHQYH